LQNSMGESVIPIIEQSEPEGFDKSVRQPGTDYLRRTPNPKIWASKEYWRRALPDLHKAYGGICAYSAHWIPCDTGNATVDHFQPKSITPQLAYEWSNFRLASSKLNSYKGDFNDVIDPFKIHFGWFILGFPSLLIKPNSNLDGSTQDQVNQTINRLKLNSEDPCIKARLHWLREFCKGASFDFLQRHAPFIAYELERQDLKGSIRSMMAFGN
jgi:hypothetical protein